MIRDELLAHFAEPIKVLDHGHVRLVDVMGDDARIEEVARLSYEGGRKRSDTRNLLRYLMRHRHTSPFEQVSITLDIKLPIFVARQLVRHRTQKLNEVSGRYSVLPEEFYVPTAEQVCYQDANNKQGRAGPVAEVDADEFTLALGATCTEAFKDYRGFIGDGIAKETARLGLPLATYTHWYTTWDAHNLLHMLALRLDPHAQWEIRQFAEAIASIVKEWLPITWEAFEDYRLNAVTISSQEVAVMRDVVATFLRDRDESHILGALKDAGCSVREIAEFRSRFMEAT